MLHATSYPHYQRSDHGTSTPNVSERGHGVLVGIDHAGISRILICISDVAIGFIMKSCGVHLSTDEAGVAGALDGAFRMAFPPLRCSCLPANATAAVQEILHLYHL